MLFLKISDSVKNADKPGHNASEGCLFVVATPIGNLDDITYRAVRILKEVDWIAAEDTRHSRKLLERYGVKKPLVAIGADEEKKKCVKLVEGLSKGEKGAIITDAGTPCASDPGGQLAAAAAREGIRVTPVPGSCALVAAYSVSGFLSTGFVFEGFPPRKGEARKDFFDRIRAERRPTVFYESPERVVATLGEAFGAMGDRPVVICRELTKFFEEILRTTLERIATGETRLETRGEFVVIIGGRAGADADINIVETDIHALVQALSAVDAPLGQLAGCVCAISGLSKNKAYRLLENLRKQQGGS